MPQAVPAPTPFPDFCGQLLALYRPPLRAPATYYAMRAALGRFACATGAETTADLTTANVARFIASRAGENVNTTISQLRAIRTATLFARDEGLIERTPQWRRLMPRPAKPVRKRHLAHDQVVTLLSHLRRRARWGTWVDGRLFTLAALVAYTGLRKQEALRLQIEDVNLDAGLLRVVARNGRLKTEASEAFVPIAGELTPLLAAWLPRSGPMWAFPGRQRLGPWRDGTPGYRPGDRLREAGEDCGVPGVTFHGLRHTLATLLVHRFGGTAEQAKTLLRHTSVRTTEDFYLHRDDADQLAAIVRNVTFAA